MVDVNSTTHHRIVHVIENELGAVRRLSGDDTWRGPTAERVHHDIDRIGHLLQRAAAIALDVEKHRLLELRS